MKKVMLLFAFLCANALYGMQEAQSFKELPEELQMYIISQLTQGNNINSIIDNIKDWRFPLFNNIQRFNTLIDALSNKFPDMYRDAIVGKFKTPLAQQYLGLGKQFVENVVSSKYNPQERLTIAKELLVKGLDPNYSYSRGHVSLLEHMYHLAIANEEKKELAEIFALLLKAGAKPTVELMEQAQLDADKYKEYSLLNLLQQYAK